MIAISLLSAGKPVLLNCIISTWWSAYSPLFLNNKYIFAFAIETSCSCTSMNYAGIIKIKVYPVVFDQFNAGQSKIILNIGKSEVYIVFVLAGILHRQLHIYQVSTKINLFYFRKKKEFHVEKGKENIKDLQKNIHLVTQSLVVPWLKL